MTKSTILLALLCAFGAALAIGSNTAVTDSTFISIPASALAGVLAVIPPQFLLFAQMRHATPTTAFSLWAGKFTLTILLAAVFARILHELALLSAGFFVLGVACGVCANVAILVRQGRV